MPDFNTDVRLLASPACSSSVGLAAISALYLVDGGGHRTADPQRAIRAICCEEDEPTLPLLAGINQRIAAVKRDFDAEEDPEVKGRLSLLSEIFTTVPLTTRAHREFNNLRHSTVTGQALSEVLL